MYYITKKDSATGKKFAKIFKKIEHANAEAMKIVNELGATKYRPNGNPFIAHGGIYSIVLDTPPNNTSILIRLLGDLENEYVPNTRTKKGKLLKQRMRNLPIVEIDEINQCIGIETIDNTSGKFRSIGFAFNDKCQYYGFSVKEEWNIKVPNDCEEVTTKSYINLFSEINYNKNNPFQIK